MSRLSRWIGYPHNEHTRFSMRVCKCPFKDSLITYRQRRRRSCQISNARRLGVIRSLRMYRRLHHLRCSNKASLRFNDAEERLRPELTEGDS